MSKKCGMTLPEVLIALVVILLGIGGALTTIVFANKTAKATANQMWAVHNARENLELLRQYTMTDPLLSVGSHSLVGGQVYVVATIVTNTISITMNIPWTNALTKSVSTASVTTVFVSSLH